MYVKELDLRFCPKLNDISSFVKAHKLSIGGKLATFEGWEALLNVHESNVHELCLESCKINDLSILRNIRCGHAFIYTHISS